MHLKSVVDEVEAVVGGEELGHAAELHGVGVVAVERPGGVPDHGPGGHEPSRHPRHQELVVLRLGQGAAELLPHLQTTGSCGFYNNWRKNTYLYYL